MNRYNKFLIALIPAIVAGLTVLSDQLGKNGTVGSRDLVAVAVAFFAALGVYAIPNVPPT